MRVLVTGANGSVGSAVAARFLRDGHGVAAFVRGPDAPAGADVHRGDITDAAALAAAARGVDLVVHCAAAITEDLDTLLRVNREGTRRLVEVIAMDRPRLVHLSTISVYDDAAGPDHDEESPLWNRPEGGYGFTKAEAERIVAGLGDDLPWTILRPALILSMHPRSRWGPIAIERARRDSAWMIPFAELPYVHVDNLVDAIVIATRAPAAVGRAYNVVESVADTRDYLAAIHGAAGRPAPPLPADARRLRFASERIRRELGWAPRDLWRAFTDSLVLPVSAGEVTER